MAGRRTNKLRYSSVLLFVLLICVCFGIFGGFLTLVQPGDAEFTHLRSVSEPTAPPLGVRLHPGIVASVVIVAIFAVVAAGFIIRKYCFPQSEVTYSYSVLRQMEQQREEESDEDLLE